MIIFTYHIENALEELEGIFYDDLNTNWKKDFAFTTDVGSTFLPTFLDITEQRRQQKWTECHKNTATFTQRALYRI